MIDDKKLAIKSTLHINQCRSSRIFNLEGISPNSERTIFSTFVGKCRADNFLNEVLKNGEKKN